MLRMLHELLSISRSHEHTDTTTAFLFGTWQEAARNLTSGITLMSYWMHLGQPVHRQNLLREGVAIIEFLCSAPHPMVRHVRKINDRWEMVPQPSKRQFDTSMHEAIRRGFDRYLAEFSSVFHEPVDIARNSRVMELRLEKLLLYPDTEDIREWSLVLHGGSSSPIRGCSNVLPIVPPVSRWSGKKKIQRLYQLCAWKRAFLKQLTPAQLENLKPHCSDLYEHKNH
jgi:hypothetical protein